MPSAQRANRPARRLRGEKRISRPCHWSEPIALHSFICVHITTLHSISSMVLLRFHSLRISTPPNFVARERIDNQLFALIGIGHDTYLCA